MLNLANTFAAIADSRVIDFVTDVGDFSSTVVTFTAKTDAARARIDGAVSFTTKKSAAPEMGCQLEAEGFRVD